MKNESKREWRCVLRYSLSNLVDRVIFDSLNFIWDAPKSGYKEVFLSHTHEQPRRFMYGEADNVEPHTYFY